MVAFTLHNLLTSTMRYPWIAALGLLSVAGAAFGQTYRCSTGSGTYYSDRPCAALGTPGKLGSIGPSRADPPYSPPLPGAPKAQEHVKYLGAGCASISEAIRTGPSRGVRRDVIDSLQEEYRLKCALEDQEARKQARDEQGQAFKAQVAERDSARAQRKQAEIRSAQCLGMRDVIALKRKREGQLNDKEVAALRDLESTYNERCIAP